MQYHFRSSNVREMIRAGMQGAPSVHKAQERIYFLTTSVLLHLSVLATVCLSSHKRLSYTVVQTMPKKLSHSTSRYGAVASLAIFLEVARS